MRLTDEEIEQLLLRPNEHPAIERFKNIEEFEAFLTERRQSEAPYGHCFAEEPTVLSFFGSTNGENILADIEQKNKAQGMGNVQIPSTKIRLINYSICPKCGHVFSFGDLAAYYANPKPDPAFKNPALQYREDTRVFCFECSSYFLPALVIVDGTPKNEVQFLCRIQTMGAVETYYRQTMERAVLSAKKENILEKAHTEGEIQGAKTITGIRNDILLSELRPKPTLISNLIQYTPANMILNLIDGSNVQKGDVLFGTWQKSA